jgi:hypothetical protein
MNSNETKKDFSTANTIIGIGIIGIGALATWYYALHWKPSNDSKFTKMWIDDQSKIDYSGEDKENPPLTHVSSGFKCMSFVGEPEFQTFMDLFKPTDYQCRWAWQYEVRNNTDTTVSVNVTYQLKDEDRFVLAESEDSVVVRPGETEMIRKVAETPVPISVLEQVWYPSWLIGMNM